MWCLLGAEIFSTMANIPTVTLPKTLQKMPMVGLGTWRAKKGEVRAAVETAIESGYRHIDCALVYGNEDEIGDGIQTKIKEGKIKREDLFITSKLWNTYHRPENVRVGIAGTLKSLKTDYVDLYLIHWPQGYVGDKGLFPQDENGKIIFSDDDYVDAWKVMEDLQKEGLAKNIGVSNFNQYQIERIIKECSVLPATNQVECHPCLTNEELLNFCKSKGITVTAHSPLGSPGRAMSDVPVLLLEDSKIVAIAERLHKTTAQIVLRWHIQRGVVVIPKSINPSRIASNIQLFDFELREDDMKTIGSFSRSYRACHLDWVSDHKYWPFKENYSE